MKSQVYVSSTTHENQPMTPQDHELTTDAVATHLRSKSGHEPTKERAHGFWVSPKGELVEEPVNILSVPQTDASTAAADEVARHLADTHKQWAVTTRHGMEHRFVFPDGSHRSLPHLVEIKAGDADTGLLKRELSRLFEGGTQLGDTVYSAFVTADAHKLVDLYRFLSAYYPHAKVRRDGRTL